MLEKIDVVHFSPAGNTRKAALLLAQAMAGRTEEYDLTRPHNTGRSFGPGDVVIVAGRYMEAACPQLCSKGWRKSRETGLLR